MLNRQQSSFEVSYCPPTRRYFYSGTFSAVLTKATYLTATAGPPSFSQPLQQATDTFILAEADIGHNLELCAVLLLSVSWTSLL